MLKSKTRKVIKEQHQKYVDYGLYLWYLKYGDEPFRSKDILWMAKDNADDQFRLSGTYLKFHMRNIPTAYATGRYLSSLNYIENVSKRNAAWKIDIKQYEQEVI